MSPDRIQAQSGFGDFFKCHVNPRVYSLEFWRHKVWVAAPDEDLSSEVGKSLSGVAFPVDKTSRLDMMLKAAHSGSHRGKTALPMHTYF